MSEKGSFFSYRGLAPGVLEQINDLDLALDLVISDYRFFPLPKISAWVPVR